MMKSIFYKWQKKVLLPSLKNNIVTPTKNNRYTLLKNMTNEVKKKKRRKMKMKRKRKKKSTTLREKKEGQHFFCFFSALGKVAFFWPFILGSFRTIYHELKEINVGTTRKTTILILFSPAASYLHLHFYSNPPESLACLLTGFRVCTFVKQIVEYFWIYRKYWKVSPLSIVIPLESKPVLQNIYLSI